MARVPRLRRADPRAGDQAAQRVRIPGMGGAAAGGEDGRNAVRQRPFARRDRSDRPFGRRLVRVRKGRRSGHHLLRAISAG